MKFKIPWKKDSVKKDLKQLEKLTEGQRRRKELEKKLFAQTFVQKKKKRKFFTFENLLTKAGIATDPKEFRKKFFFVAIIIHLVLTFVLLGFMSYYESGVKNMLVLSAAFWTVGFAANILLLSLWTATYLDIRIKNRRQQLELVLPDFLQLAAANIGAGMTIDRALWNAVRPRFGVLAQEIEDVAKQVIAGKELEDALRDFTLRYESATLTRSINLLIEGIAAGGKIADLLHKIATDIQEQQILRKEMAANVMTYVIFISFAAVGAAPILFGLSTQLLEVIQTIAGNMATDGGVGGFQINAQAITLGNFRIFSIVILFFTSMMSAFIVSAIQKGDASEGFRLLPFYSVISIVLYFISVWMFGKMFGGLV